MKNVFKKLLMAILFLAALETMANDGLDLKINEDQSLTVEVEKIEKGAILSLKNDNGEIVFRDTFNDQESYTKIFDFEKLSNGEYTLVLDKEFSISTSKIRKMEDKISIEKDSYKLDFKPLYKNNGEKILLYLANPEENSVEIKIFDKFGVTVGEIRCDDLVVKRTLDFSKVPSGNYFVKIRTKTNSFSKTLNVG